MKSDDKISTLIKEFKNELNNSKIEFQRVRDKLDMLETNIRYLQTYQRLKFIVEEIENDTTTYKVEALSKGKELIQVIQDLGDKRINQFLANTLGNISKNFRNVLRQELEDKKLIGSDKK